MQCVMTNLKGVEGAASSQQLGFEFNSMVNFNGSRFGASHLGLSEICCGQTDGGVSIAAYFILAATDLGQQSDKRARYVYLGLETNGSLDLTLTTNGGLSKTYRITPKKPGQQRFRVTIGRGTTDKPFVWRWLTIKIANVGGCDFSIDKIEILPIIKSGGVL